MPTGSPPLPSWLRRRCWWGWLGLVLAAGAEARTIRGVLGDAQERADLRPAPAFRNFAAHFATLVTAPSLTSATSAALAGTAPIDSSMATLGPIFLDHAATLGAGVTNVNVVAQRAFADATLFSQPFNALGQFTPRVLAQRTPTGDPTSPALLGIRLRYNLDLHVWAAAVAVSHGVTDDFDLSVVLPVLSTRLDCAVGARVVQATGPDGGAFMPVNGPTLGGTIPAVDATGIGDVAVRGKYKLPSPRPWRAALTLEVEFPTGDEAQLHGTGAYWIAPGIDLALPLWEKRAELDAHAALNFNVNHSIQSQALYGVSGSVVLWPKRLAAIVEFLGTSQLDSAFAPNDTDVLVLTPNGVSADPLLGVGWSSRLDQFNLSFGLRAIIPPGIILFANGVYALNSDVGVRPVGVIPTVGLGMSF
jgi:hypothetical protein